MIEHGKHCGHDCCDEPHNPFHDHFLRPDQCNNCIAIGRAREEAVADIKRLHGLISEAAAAPVPATTPTEEQK